MRRTPVSDTALTDHTSKQNAPHRHYTRSVTDADVAIRLCRMACSLLMLVSPSFSRAQEGSATVDQRVEQPWMGETRRWIDPDSLLVMIRPGDPSINVARLASDTVRYSLNVYRGASRTPVGQLIDELVRDSSTGRVLLRRVRTAGRGASRVIDSTATDAATLEPVRLRSVQPTRLVSLDYQNRRVRGSVGPINAPPVPMDTTLPVRVFGAANWDLLLRTLPLTKGYAAQFQIFDIDAGIRTYRIAVTGSAMVQGEDAHVVVFTMTRSRESVVWIGKESGQLLRMQTMLGSGTMLEQERMSGSP